MFAGSTVIIALVGLTVVNIPFLTVMGLAAAGTVAIAVLIALTLTPALLGFAGGRAARLNRVLGYRPRKRSTADQDSSASATRGSSPGTGSRCCWPASRCWSRSRSPRST